MNRKTMAAVGTAAVLVIGGGAWAGLGSATATTASPSIQSWPSSTVPAAKVIAATRADAAGTDGSQVLLLRAHQVRGTFVDVGGDGPTPGDYFMFDEQLRYMHGDKIVGRDSGRCTLGLTRAESTCDATGQLFGLGKITIYGGGFGRTDSRYAVTGGTGIYKGVGGQLDVGNLRHGDSLLAFEITR